ncbi:outer membrane beta-barrel family protein [Sediminicola luteus]|nr:outer membrane beta-barrel family protein [Sediminicola luteus]
MKYVIPLIFVLTSLVVSGQNRLEGKIIDAQSGQVLEFATVSLHQNGALINGIITDLEGKFELEVPSGTYLLRAEFLSYKAYEIEVVLDKNLVIAPIALTPDVQQLEGVELSGEKATIGLSLDKKVFNVGKDLLSANGSLSQVLDNVPSVTVDVDGAVALRGNPNVTLLINGKPSVLVANNGLEQIPAEQIERVEVITNPSSNMQAQGTAGIINIVLKRNRADGFNGSISATTGTPANHRLSANLNYHTGKLNLFSTLGVRYLEFIGSQEVDQSNANAFFLKQNAEINRNYRNLNLYVGGEYQIDSTQSITSAFYRSMNRARNRIHSTYDYFNTAMDLDSTLTRLENYREPQNYNQWEANYTKNFDREGQKLTLDFQYDFWDDDENENFTSAITFPEYLAKNDLRTNNIESSDDFLIQADFTSPIGESGRFETGIRGETRVITSKYLAETFTDGQWQTYLGIDNDVDYHETIGGAYVQYGNQWGKLKYQMGLRTEYTKIKIEDNKGDFTDEKEYTRVFPTSHLAYNFNETTELRLGYSSRINRPRFWQLNPFGGLSDISEIRLGNPDLDPAFTDAIELSFLSRWEGLTLQPALYYQKTDNAFSFFNTSNPNGIISYFPVNLDYEERLGAELSVNYRPLNWLNLSGELNYYRFLQKGSVDGQSLDSEDQTWTARFNTRMRLPAQMRLQAGFNFRTANQSAQTLTEPVYFLDFGLSKNFWQNKATLSFNASNLFDLRIRETRTTGVGFYRHSKRNLIGDRYSLSFIYRFNPKKDQKERGPSDSNRQ